MSEQWGRRAWVDQLSPHGFIEWDDAPPPPPQLDRQLISDYETPHYDWCGLANTLYLFALAIVTGAAIGLLLWKIFGR